MKVDLHIAENFVQRVVGKTSGFSVEQLEQIYSVLMDKIWRTRGDWDRVRVTEQVAEAFEDCLEDMEHFQTFGEPSGEFDDRLGY